MNIDVNYFNNTLGWGKELTKAFQENNESVINAFKECNYFNDEYMFEFSLLAGKFDIAREYYIKLINDPNYVQYKVIYNNDKFRIKITSIKTNKFKNIRLIEDNRFKCDFDELEKFIATLNI